MGHPRNYVPPLQIIVFEKKKKKVSALSLPFARVESFPTTHSIHILLQSPHIYSSLPISLHLIVFKSFFIPLFSVSSPIPQILSPSNHTVLPKPSVQSSAQVLLLPSSYSKTAKTSKSLLAAAQSSHNSSQDT